MLNKVTFAYNKWQDALTEATAEFGEGVHLLLGPNGAGKTTMLKVIAGLIRPKSGECLYDGLSTAAHAPATVKDIFMLTEGTQYPLDTINDMARLHAVFYADFSRDFLDEALQAFALTGNEKLSDLSLGNRRKAQLAYALALGTQVLLLDEPANGLDMTSKRTLTTLISKAMDLNTDRCVIVATHTVQEMRNLYDTVTVVNHGRVIINASVAHICDRLAFVRGSQRHDDALCYEASIDGPTQILPNTEGIETPIDYSLLFAAAIGDKSETLKNLLS